MLERDDKSGSDVQRKIDELNRFFESKQLKKMDEEFLEVQRKFHAKMQNLVQACREIFPQLNEADQQLLEKLLAPYGALVANPFPEESSGDLRKDIADILAVINQRNEQHFHKLLTSLMLASSNILELQQLLEKFQSEPAIKEKLLQELKTGSWSEVGMHVTHPMQHLARYELLLKAFDKTLSDNGLQPTEKLRLDFSDALVRVMPELTFFNQQRELLSQLNDIEAMLQRMETIPAEKREPVRLYTKEIRRQIAEGKVEVLDALDGMCELLKMLKKDMTPSFLSKGAGLIKGASYYGITMFTDPVFGENAILSKPVDHYAELSKVIDSLEFKCGQIRDIQKLEGISVIRPSQAFM